NYNPRRKKLVNTLNEGPGKSPDLKAKTSMKFTQNFLDCQRPPYIFQRCPCTYIIMSFHVLPQFFPTLTSNNRAQILGYHRIRLFKKFAIAIEDNTKKLHSHV